MLDGGGGGLYVFDGMGTEVVTVERVELVLYVFDRMGVVVDTVELVLYVLDGMRTEVVTVERVELGLYTVEMAAGVEEEEETGGASHGSVDSRSVET